MPTRRQLANALRVLSMDAIEKAHSGHPGAPLGMADMAEALWRHGLKHNPANPTWCDRDRFVLSNGHASMLLYALLHLSGYALSMEDIKNFRSLGSKTPGHPEFGVTPGVDMTTGPLGQGIASAVGMALAERLLAARYNRPGHTIVDHYTYCFCGDGCLMEGVSAEACSLAGTWKLGRLIVYYDANGISIDGAVNAWFSEDVAARFKALSWQVIGPIDGHDPLALDQALAEARADQNHPSLIICTTHIGFGAKQEDSASSHGAPLGEESIAQAKAAYGWSEQPFVIPAEIAEAWDARESGAQAEAEWQARFAAYAQSYPEDAASFERRIKGDLPKDAREQAQKLIETILAEHKDMASRKASKECLETWVPFLPELIGGSADLTGSVGTLTKSQKPLDPSTYEGSYLYYGVREFGMSCIMNGLALHGGFLPYAGTFLSFLDQAKNALRLAALMQVHAIWVFTHDSIGVGEDGPTHQPVEQIASLRMIPGLAVWRPCDSVETAYAWREAIFQKKPTCLLLSRQTLPFISRTQAELAGIERGGYVLKDAPNAELILIATGSEVALALQAWQALQDQGVSARVVSMPSTDRFDAQSAEWKESVLPRAIRARIAIEAGSKEYWYKYVGLDGLVLGMDSFGLSGPAKDVFAHFGFTADRIVQSALHLLGR